jgi:hypothetical protein
MTHRVGVTHTHTYKLAGVVHAWWTTDNAMTSIHRAHLARAGHVSLIAIGGLVAGIRRRGRSRRTR